MHGMGQPGRRVAIALLALALTLAGWGEATEPQPTVGHAAPDFTAADVRGHPVRLADFRGKRAVLLNFWATWCVPCRLEMPTMEQAYRDYKARGLEILAVSIDVGHPLMQTRELVLGNAGLLPHQPPLPTGREQGRGAQGVRECNTGKCVCIIETCISHGTPHSSRRAPRKNDARSRRCLRFRSRDVRTAPSRSSRSVGAKFARSPYLVWPQTCSAGLRSGA